MVKDPVREFQKRFPEEFKVRQKISEKKGPKAVLNYIFKKYAYLGKDLTCANCWACAKTGIRGDFTPVVKCRFVPAWRPLFRDVCELFYPKRGA
jgi:hypothetical protein